MNRRATACLALALLASGCATGTPQGPLEPLVVGAEQHLTPDWRAEPRDGGAVVWGYLVNQSPYTFDRIRLLVDALAPDGGIAAQRLVWAPGLLGAWGRTYFEAPMPAAPGYRVRVFSYDRVETDGFRRGIIW
jgi:hypothetical protein